MFLMTLRWHNDGAVGDAALACHGAGLVADDYVLSFQQQQQQQFECCRPNRAIHSAMLLLW